MPRVPPSRLAAQPSPWPRQRPPRRFRRAWKDLCRSPHRTSTKLIGNGFALTKASGAYWKGDQSERPAPAHLRHRPGLKEDLVAYRRRIKEAERRDHRRLGTELDLYSFPEEIGPGLVYPPPGRHPAPRDRVLRD